MLILKIVEYGCVLLFAVMVVSQIILPAIRQRPLFPMLNKRLNKSKNELRNLGISADINSLKKQATKLKRKV